jgi:hypothetical protein
MAEDEKRVLIPIRFNRFNRDSYCGCSGIAVFSQAH